MSKSKYKILIFCLISLVFIGCDRATKDLARIHLKDKDPVSFFHNTVRLEYVENTGAFLSFGDGLSKSLSFWLLSVLPLLFLFGFFVFALRRSGHMNFLEMLPFTLIFSGGVGNIIDRLLFDRHVTDFMNVGIQSLRSGIFNFADLYITAGVLILVVKNARRANP
jgi:signal peptidase II